MEIIKDENGKEIRVIRDAEGNIRVRIHGEFNIDTTAKFMLDTYKRNLKGDS